jgi:hypothetical protein
MPSIMTESTRHIKATLYAPKKENKMKYLKTTQMGVSCIQTLADAKEELESFYENAFPGNDTLETAVVEMTEEEFEKLPEFQGY